MTGDTESGEALGPVQRAQAMDRPAKPKRFYKVAAAEQRGDLFAVTLDGRIAKTPGRAQLAVRSEALAQALAEEWAAQGAEIDPVTMPLTRLVNSAIDGVADRTEAVAADLVAYAGTDLICYRAATPQALISRQASAWDPLLRWAADDLGARLLTGQGVMPVLQPQAALDAVARAVAPLQPLPLAAAHVMTTLTGSAIIALAVVRGRLSAREAWTAAHVDEDWEISQWGEDSEAVRRRQSRWVDMHAAARLLQLIG